MLVTIFNSEFFHNNYSLSFSYINHDLYREGLQNRLTRQDLVTYPIKFWNLTNSQKLPCWLPDRSKEYVMKGIRFILRGPLLLFQVLYFYKLLKKINPDILHINNGGYPASRSARAAAIAAKLSGINAVIMVVNNMAIGYVSCTRWIDFPIDLIVIRCVNKFVTGSRAAGIRLKEVLKLPPQKLHAIHNGITIRSAIASNEMTRKRLAVEDFDGVIFGVVALMIPRKGHKFLLEAVRKLVQEKRLKAEQFKILIEGDGPLLHDLVDFVEANKLGAFVSFVGVEANIFDFISILDALVLPSIRDEDLPNVILEAMALGKPVIASDLAGTPEQVLEGITGFLIESGNVSQLSEAISKLIYSQELRLTMGHESLRQFNNFFTSDLALDNYDKLYKQILRHRT